MKIGYISDIHVDMGMLITDLYNLFDQNVDVLIIAGDIGRPIQTVSFIDMLLDTFNTTIIFVPGNHDYYNYTNMTVEDVNAFYKQEFIDDNVHVLVNGEKINIYGVNFVGATLWSDLADRYNPTISVQSQIMANTAISDFEFISGMNVFEMRKQYEIDRNGIINSLSSIDMENTIIITHFSKFIPFIDFLLLISFLIHQSIQLSNF